MRCAVRYTHILRTHDMLYVSLLRGCSAPKLVEAGCWLAKCARYKHVEMDMQIANHRGACHMQ